METATNRASDPLRWAATAAVQAEEIDCCTAVMLKILDGKCKMSSDEKRIMTRLYDAVSSRPGHLLGDAYHALIREARQQPSAELLERVYEHRVLAETMISRPVMKTFKARLRREGVLPPMNG